MVEKSSSKIKLIAIVATIVLAIVGILMATEDTQINFEATYNIPAFNSLAELPTTDYGQWAVAVDNNVVITSEPSAPLPATPTASTAKMILALAVMQAKPFNLGEKGETITISSEYFNRYLWYVANGGFYANNGLMLFPPMALILVGCIIWAHRSYNKDLQEK